MSKAQSSGGFVFSIEVPQNQPRLAQAPIYELWINQKWQADPRYQHQLWLRWSWCKLDEVVELINKNFNVRWTRAGLLKRFGIPKEAGRVKAGDSTKEVRFDLHILWIDEVGNELHCNAFSKADLGNAEKWNMTPYVSAGWVRDVLWALYTRCSRAFRDPDGQKVAADENGTGIFYMVSSRRNTSASKT